MAPRSGRSSRSPRASRRASSSSASPGSAPSIGKLVNDPTHRSLLADYYPPEARGYAYYLHTGANSVGVVVAPILAGGLASLASWRLPFIVMAVPTAVLVAVGVARLREPVRGAARAS